MPSNIFVQQHMIENSLMPIEEMEKIKKENEVISFDFSIDEGQQIVHFKGFKFDGSVYIETLKIVSYTTL